MFADHEVKLLSVIAQSGKEGGYKREKRTTLGGNSSLKKGRKEKGEKNGHVHLFLATNAFLMKQGQGHLLSSFHLVLLLSTQQMQWVKCNFCSSLKYE